MPILKSRDRFEEEDPILEYLALVPALPTRQASNEICIEFGQRRWTFDGRVEHILNFVANKRQFKLSELVSHVSGSIESQTVSEFVGELIGEGILGVRT